MKIAIIQPRASYYVGGSEKIALRHAKYLAALPDNEIHFYTINPNTSRGYLHYSELFNEFKDQKKQHINIVEKAIPNNFIEVFKEVPGQDQNRWDSESILFSNLVYEDIVKSKYDVILSYYLVDSQFKGLETPNVVYLGGHSRENIHIYKSFLRFCDGVICNSFNTMKMWGGELDATSINYRCLLGKGVDGFDLRTNFKNSNIVFAGRLIKRKGVDMLIHAISNLIVDYPEINLIILGDGPERENLENLSRTLQVNHCVKFLGYVKDTRKYFADSLLSVFPSREGEGLMTVVAEAMATGSCIVTTTGMGNEELISNGENGILVEPGNQSALTAAIKALLSDRDSVQRMGQGAYHYAQSNLSWDKVAEKLQSFLSEIVSDR